MRRALCASQQTWRALSRTVSGASNPIPYPVGIEVNDDAVAWESAGFYVEKKCGGSGGIVMLGEIEVRLLGRGDTSIGWKFVNLPAGINSIHGVRTVSATEQQVRQLSYKSTRPKHPNGVVGIDHIVMKSPDWRAGIDDFRAIGLEPLRQTSAVRKGITQVIYRPKDTIIELVGPDDTTETMSARAELWGLTLVTNDVDQTHKALSESTKAPWPAVQPGRRMTVLNHARHSISMAIAFMTPHVKGLEGEKDARERTFARRAREQEAILQNRSSRL